MTNLTRQQREMICASDPDDVSGEEGCGAQFHENDAGALVLGLPAAPTGAK